MPLSEEEAKLLAQLEQSLAAEDPDLASRLRGSTLAAQTRRILALCIAGLLAGLAVLLGGAVTENVVVAVGGFVLMLGSAQLFARTWRRRRLGTAGPAGSTSAAKAPRQSFVARMEERWNRRQDNGH